MLGVVKKDIEEQRARLLGGRGLTYAQLAGRLIQIGHPQTAGAVELMLEDLLLPPARARSDNPEMVVVAFAENAGEGSAVAAPMVRQVVEAYYGLPLTPLPLPEPPDEE
jgi:hypothetical protein